MLLKKEEKNTFMTGPLDAMFILHNVKTNKYHPCFFENAPTPGPIQNISSIDIVRLKSRFHHTSGFDSLKEATDYQINLSKTTLKTDVENVFEEIIEWNGQISIILIKNNWRKNDPKILQLETVLNYT